LCREGRHPPPVGIHAVADALYAVEPEATGCIPIDAGIMPQVPAPASTGARFLEPFALGCGEVDGLLHRGRMIWS